MPDLENSRKRCRVGPGQTAGETAEKQPEKHPKHPKQKFFGCLAAHPAVSRLFSRQFTRGPLGTFFGCFQGPAFGASVAGRADRKIFCPSLKGRKAPRNPQKKFTQKSITEFTLSEYSYLNLEMTTQGSLSLRALSENPIPPPNKKHVNSTTPPRRQVPDLLKMPVSRLFVLYASLPRKSGARLRDHMSGHVRPRQGTEICNFGAPSPLEALHWIFCFFFSIYVQFSKTSPLKSGESSEKSSGENRVKSCHVCGCQLHEIMFSELIWQ